MDEEVRPDRMLAALARRADYLDRLRAEKRANTYHLAERAALRWAIAELTPLHPMPTPKGRKKP